MRDDDNIYDQATADAVARFQVRHGLAVDGVVGPNTLAELNVTPGERAQAIVANLERMHWITSDGTLGERRAEVNIAGYELVAYDDNEVALTMPVIVGLSYHRTPIFSDKVVGCDYGATSYAA